MTLTSLIPTIIAVLTMIAATFAPQIQAIIAGHPLVATVIAGIATIVSHWLPSPLHTP